MGVIPLSESLAILGQNLFSGISIGGVYALVALGIAMIYRSTGVTNFAQGDITMLGAYILFLFSEGLKLPYLLSFLLALVVMGVFGLLFELGVYFPLRNRTYLPVIIATIGAGILFQNGALVIFGSQPQKVRPIINFGGTGGITLGGIFFDYQYIVIFVVTVVLVAFQYLFFEYSTIGKKMQATAQDKVMAQLVGIPIAFMIALTFIYSTLLGGLAGMLVAPIFFVTHKLGITLGLKAFAATICGGFGNVLGAIIGGLAIGIVESLGAAYISPVYKDAFPFLLLLVFLLFRPQGIFGEKVSEKA
jgi:branched-chain amino acid transport system permease protein